MTIFKKLIIGIGDVARVSFFVTWIFFILLAFSGVIFSVNGIAKEIMISAMVLGMPILCLLWFVGHFVYCSGYISTQNSGITGHKWDKDWYENL